MFLLIELSKVSKAYNFREHKIIEMIYCDRFKIKIEVWIISVHLIIAYFIENWKIENNKKLFFDYCLLLKLLFTYLFARFMFHEQCNSHWLKKKQPWKRQTWTPYAQNKLTLNYKVIIIKKKKRKKERKSNNSPYLRKCNGSWFPKGLFTLVSGAL